MKKVPVTFEGKVIGEAEVDKDGMASATLSTERFKKTLPGHNPCESLSIAEPVRRDVAEVNFVIDIDINAEEYFSEKQKGTFDR